MKKAQIAVLGVAVAACSFFLISSIGQFVSIWQPHPLTKSGMRGMRPPLVVVLATMGTVFGGGGLLFFASYSLFQRAPQWSGVVMSLVAVLLAIGSRALLRFMKWYTTQVIGQDVDIMRVQLEGLTSAPGGLDFRSTEADLLPWRAARGAAGREQLSRLHVRACRATGLHPPLPQSGHDLGRDSYAAAPT